MTLTLELTPAEEARVRAAAGLKGIGAEECVRQLIADHLPDPPAGAATLEVGPERGL